MHSIADGTFTKDLYGPLLVSHLLKFPRRRYSMPAMYLGKRFVPRRRKLASVRSFPKTVGQRRRWGANAAY